MNLVKCDFCMAFLSIFILLVDSLACFNYLVLFAAKIKLVNLVYVIFNNLIQSNLSIGFSIV